MPMSGRLQGKVAIVTGGGSGFGAGIVKKFTSEGAKVLVLDINEIDAQKVASASPKSSAIPLRGDVSSESDWKTALNTVTSEFGGLDVVVNNAGVVHKAQSSIEVSEEDYDRMFNINVKQLYWSTRVVIPYFRENGRAGLFINLSSTSAPRPRPNLVWYAASKGAVSNATKGLAIEWAKDNIRFNAICPVAGETNMVPLFLGQPDTPEAPSFLASDEATFLTGVCLEVDGG
ncbi:MAG: Dehydrogenase reductase SDR member 4, partial [Pleopsidium flavum]